MFCILAGERREHVSVVAFGDMLQNLDTESLMTVAHLRQVGTLLRSLAAVIAPRRTAPAPTRSARPIIDLL